MIQVAYAVGGSEVILDSRSNRVSIINFLDSLASPGFPLVLSKVSLCFIITRDEGDADEHQLTLRAMVGETEVMTGPVPCSFQGTRRTRVFTNMVGFPVTQPGTVRFVLRRADGSDLGSFSFEVERAAAPTPQLEIPTERQTQDASGDSGVLAI